MNEENRFCGEHLRKGRQWHTTVVSSSGQSEDRLLFTTMTRNCQMNAPSVGMASVWAAADALVVTHVRVVVALSDREHVDEPGVGDRDGADDRDSQMAVVCVSVAHKDTRGRRRRRLRQIPLPVTERSCAPRRRRKN